MSLHNDDTDGIKGIEALREQWPGLFNAGRITELSETFYAEDAVALPPDLDASFGREAIRALLQGFVDSGDVSFELGVIETHSSGDTGYLVGNYKFTDATSGEAVVHDGRTLETYRREPDGSWKCVADMWHHID
jgi:ketosteroid isomerase-like protein